MSDLTLSQRIGRRGAALLFFTALDFVYCYALLTADRPLVPFYAWMNEVVPLPVWAAAWGAVGLVCAFYAFRVFDTIGFMFAVGLKVGWSIMSFLGWLDGAVDRGYLSAAIWMAFAAFVVLISGGIPAAPPRPAGRWSLWTRSSSPRSPRSV